jgi:hypothetical protein
MFKVSEKAKEEIKEFFKKNSVPSPIRITETRG